MSKKILILGFVIALIGVLFFAFSSKNVNSYEAVSSYEEDIIIYKSESCGCCDVYSNYFKGKGNSKTKVVNLQDLQALKNKYKIPVNMNSCHTTIIGDYFIEGHIPLEAVNRLLTEKPNIKGIAMPGMPSGSPGMPGAKNEDFVVYSVDYDGSYSEWMRI